jgi:hypothetical protein
MLLDFFFLFGAGLFGPLVLFAHLPVLRPRRRPSRMEKVRILY